MNKIISKILAVKTWLMGKKTYIIGGITLVGTAYAYLVKDLSLKEAIQLYAQAILSMTIRAGIGAKKTPPTVTP